MTNVAPYELSVANPWVELEQVVDESTGRHTFLVHKAGEFYNKIT